MPREGRVVNSPADSDPALPVWARTADAVTVVLGIAAACTLVFGGIRVGTLFSMSTPWRALFGLFVICGLRHYLVRRPAIYQRAWNALRHSKRLAAHAGGTAGAARFEALHVVGLWNLAVAQPIFDLLRGSPEFFVAHDTRPTDLLALVLLLCLGGPAVCLLAMRLAGPRWRDRAVAVVIGSLAAAVALSAAKSLPISPGQLLLGLAAGAGVLAGTAYLRYAPIRLFATFLAPAVIVVPVVFLLQPGTAQLLRPPAEPAPLDNIGFADTPPVVVVVFDQLPLASLLDRQGAFDRTTYPHFAALADDATWFRNATAVSELTNYALPAILTGMYPTPGRLPLAAEHPNNLFTLLGARYRLHVREPLTGLCPETLCPPARAGPVAWLAAVVRDLTVVYLTVVLPDDLAAGLPPVTQGWRDFAARETFGGAWRTQRTSDRSETLSGFIESITGGGGPALHFMHALLPHEPWLYLPTGQQLTFNRRIIGIQNGIWVDDPWAAALNYQRHLLQVGYVDTLLGRLTARLRETGIYDDALIVVAADHGASLRPGLPFRRPSEPSMFTDIAAVPLLVKRPSQRHGVVIDTNVETIDILPTLASELGIRLPWTPDGSNALDPARAPRPSKVLFFDGARNRMAAPGALGDALMNSVGRKFAFFPTGDPLVPPTPGGLHDDLIGRAVGALRLGRPAEIEVAIDTTELLREMDPDADFLPAHLTGAVFDLPDGAPPPMLAVAVNGVVAAVTRPYSFPVFGRRAAWEAIVNPALFKPGANAVEMFVIREEADGAVELAATRGSSGPNRQANLMREETASALGVVTSGFYSTEWARNQAFRWTDGAARLVVPIDPQSLPAELAVEVLMTGRPKRLRIAVNGCALFDETVRSQWTGTFALDACRLGSPDLEIELLSATHVPETRDNRKLGIAVSLVALHDGAAE